MSLSSEKNEAYQSSEFQENLEILRETYLFSGLPMETLKVLAYIGTRETYKQGEYLFRQGDDDGQAFYILSGELRLVRTTDESGEQTMRDYDSGQFLCGIALLGKMHRLFSLKALTDVTCLILSREKFGSTMERFPELMPKIIKSVAEKISAWEERLLVSRAESCETCRQNIGVSLL
ncbi:MAG: cyclic nucleotide-binding domain-containing protein [Pseudomonadota bacterium]